LIRKKVRGLDKKLIINCLILKKPNVSEMFNK